MAKSFKTLREKMHPESAARAEEKAERILASMPLQELRAAREISQEKLAKALNMKQPSVSKMEKRTDMYISSLRAAISAMGGKLEITAKFSDGSVRINQFENLEAKHILADYDNSIEQQEITSYGLTSPSKKPINIGEKVTRRKHFDPSCFFVVSPVNLEAAREIPKWTPSLGALLDRETGNDLRKIYG